MFVERMRARYWAAMGLSALPLIGCTRKLSSAVTVDPLASATSSGIATGLGVPIAPPSCPNGDFCEPQPLKLPQDAGAVAPYTMCAATVLKPGENRPSSERETYVTFDADKTKAERITTANACCYQWKTMCPGGRPFRDEAGVSHVAGVRERADWLAGALADAADCEPRLRQACAARWIEEAQFEHASIASFAQFTLELLALGAPAHLVEQSQRASLDEIEHARIAFSLATAFAGRALGPLPLDLPKPASAPSLANLVRSALLDGCIGEARAALALRREAEATSRRSLRKILNRIAEDEERHAALSYATVAWAASIDRKTTKTVVEEVLSRSFDERSAYVVAELAEPCLRPLLVDDWRTTTGNLAAVSNEGAGQPEGTMSRMT